MLLTKWKFWSGYHLCWTVDPCISFPFNCYSQNENSDQVIIFAGELILILVFHTSCCVRFRNSFICFLCLFFPFGLLFQYVNGWLLLMGSSVIIMMYSHCSSLCRASVLPWWSVAKDECQLVCCLYFYSRLCGLLRAISWWMHFCGTSSILNISVFRDCNSQKFGFIIKTLPLLRECSFV